MNDVLFRLSTYLHEKTPHVKTFFYRHRSTLNKRCVEISAVGWIEDEHTFKLAEEFARFGLLHWDDLSAELRIPAYHAWLRHLPKDPRFFKMMIEQWSLWMRFQNETVLTFLNSPEAKRWYSVRKHLKRKPLFELDMPYKKSKASALAYEERVRALLRENPTLRWSDLKHLGVKNAQALWENFPHRENHREAFLEGLKQRLDIS